MTISKPIRHGVRSIEELQRLKIELRDQLMWADTRKGQDMLKTKYGRVCRELQAAIAKSGGKAGRQS